MDDEQEEHTVGSLDTSMDRYLEYHGLWRKRIPQGWIEYVLFCVRFACLFKMAQVYFVRFQKR